MSALGTTYPYRAAVTVENPAGAGTVDVEFTIPKDWDQFWTTVLSNGHDIRFTASDGVTPRAFERDAGWDVATRTGQIRIDNLALPAVAGMYNIWIYWGDPAAAEGSTVNAVAAPKNAWIEQAAPPTEDVIVLAPEVPGATRPRRRFAKASADQRFAWFNVTKLLEFRRRTYNGALNLDELLGASIAVLAAGVPDATMVDQSAQRFVYNAGETFVKALFKGGTDGDDYTISCTISTVTNGGGVTPNKTFNARALLQVRDVSEV